MYNIDDFNLDNIINENGDVFQEEKKVQTDERFYTLPKKADGSGSALIAFIPDKNKKPMIRMYKIRTTISEGKQKRWLNAWSPKSIGKPCPFQETYINYYNEDSDMALKFKPTERWICNIKVIKDSEKPENEGKIFLYEMSKSMAEKIKDTLTLSQDDIDMGVERKEIFNPFKGWIFNLKCFKNTNGFTDYSTSAFTQLTGGRTIYNLKGEFTEECKKEGINDILNKTYDLSEFQKPENFMSYDDLRKELERVCSGIFGIGSRRGSSEPITINEPSNTPEVEIKSAETRPTESVVVSEPKVGEAKQEPQKSSSDNIDDFLRNLGQ